ncbi:ead/Ea22-like family protein [Salmonella enterica]|nr:ead/Ea22-like family protein [Salmonella enterica subsp. diarizonae]MFX13752.1 ead/Ea22-like family protein [Salmonella enterica]
MSNDITALAQRMKAAAEKATPGDWHKSRQDPVTGIIKIYARTGVTKLNCVVKTDAHEVGFGISEREHRANAELIALANPANVLALVAALEKAQQENGAGVAGMAESYETTISMLKSRISELESRTVTLEPFRSFVTNDDIAALHRFAECCDDPESGGHDLEIEQVRRLEAIGALQRSGRVSYITGFGDVLISITAGIQVKES